MNKYEFEYSVAGVYGIETPATLEELHATIQRAIAGHTNALKAMGMNITWELRQNDKVVFCGVNFNAWDIERLNKWFREQGHE